MDTDVFVHILSKLMLNTEHLKMWMQTCMHLTSKPPVKVRPYGAIQICLLLLLLKNVSSDLDIERKRFGASCKDWAEAVG